MSSSTGTTTSFSPSLGHVLLCCLFISGSQSRRYSSRYRTEGLAMRQGGYPKFPFESPVTDSVPCGLKVSPKVVGGITPEYGDHPWQVQFEIYKRGSVGFSHQCGGALISPTHILTAAHCLHGFHKGDMRIKAGVHHLDQLDEGEQIFSIEDWLVHPDFKKGGEYSNDVGVVKIAPRPKGQGVEMSRYVSTVCLPSEFTPYIAGTKCRVTGWGYTDPKTDWDYSKVLQSAEVPLMSNKMCESFYGKDFLPGMLCAGYVAGKIDACNGDSGGPLVCEIDGHHTIMGVVSWGKDCAKASLPGVYTSTQYYRDWILRAVEDL